MTLDAAQPSAPRLRLACLAITPVLMWDDGTELTPGPTAAAVHLPLSEIPAFLERLPVELAKAESQAATGATA